MSSLLTWFEHELTTFAATRYADADALCEALRYVLLGGGKRVRPVLCLLASEAAGGTRAEALPGALALEMIHTYSLVHDDLPCMDDDDLRRGRPTAHKVYGDAIALLAGDALLTDAFAVIAESRLNDTAIACMTRELAQAAGGAGMVLGQARDLHWTARQGATRGALDDIHLRKTGYLLGASAALGAAAAGASLETIGAFRDFGRGVGLAFQILDDLLDDSATTGKSQGKDQKAGKLTYLTQMPRAEAEREAQRVTAAAVDRLRGTGLPVGPLCAFGDELLRRAR